MVVQTTALFFFLEMVNEFNLNGTLINQDRSIIQPGKVKILKMELDESLRAVQQGICICTAITVKTIVILFKITDREFTK